MFLYLCLLGILFNQVHSYVLLQVSKDDKNRSNVDALIHKVVPSDQYEKIAAKLTRKQLPTYRTKELQNQDETPDIKSKDMSAEAESDNFLSNLIKDIFSSKPVLRTKTFHIEPEVINFRSNKQSLLYEVPADTFVEAVRDLLSSKAVNQAVEQIAKKAAVVYRSMNDS